MELDSLTMDRIEETSIALDMEDSAIIMMDTSRSDDKSVNHHNESVLFQEDDSGILDRATCMSVDDDDDDYVDMNFNEHVLRGVVQNKHRIKGSKTTNPQKPNQRPQQSTEQHLQRAFSNSNNQVAPKWQSKITTAMTPQNKIKQTAFDQSATLVSPLTMADEEDYPNHHNSSPSSSSVSTNSTSPTSITMTPMGGMGVAATSNSSMICDMSSIVGGADITIHGDILLPPEDEGRKGQHGLVSPSSTHVDDIVVGHQPKQPLHRPTTSKRCQKQLQKKNSDSNKHEAAKLIIMEDEHEDEVTPEDLLERLQLHNDDENNNITDNSTSQLISLSPSRNQRDGAIGHHHFINIQQPEIPNEGLISKRLQDIEFKKLALHRKRISLEQRLFDFVDNEKRMRILTGSSGSSAASMMYHHPNNSSMNGSLNRSLQSTQSLLQPPTPSPRKHLMRQQKHRFSSASPMHTHQNGDQMVMDYPWKDPRAKGNNSDDGEEVIAYYYTGPLNKIKQPHGIGTMRFLDGQEYEGQIYAGYRWGMGTNRWPDGQVYVGEWDDHSRNGRGTHTWKDGRRVTGQWSGGHLNGRVIFSWPNGASYDGECRMGKKHGRGTHTWTNGRLYTGNFENGKEHGFGSLTQSDCRYRGNFENGKRSGIGMQIWTNKTYDGEWKNNKADGKGRIVWQNGATYTGEFTAGKYHGLGGTSQLAKGQHSHSPCRNK